MNYFNWVKSTILVILLVAIASCGCKDDDPLFIYGTGFKFVDNMSQQLFGLGGVYANEEIELFYIDGEKKVPIQYYSENDESLGKIYVAFDPNEVILENGESYIIEYPDSKRDTIAVFYEKYELPGKGCDYTNFELKNVTVNNEEIQFNNSFEVVIIKRQ